MFYEQTNKTNYYILDFFSHCCNVAKTVKNPLEKSFFVKLPALCEVHYLYWYSGGNTRQDGTVKSFKNDLIVPTYIILNQINASRLSVWSNQNLTILFKKDTRYICNCSFGASTQWIMQLLPIVAWFKIVDFRGVCYYKRRNSK